MSGQLPPVAQKRGQAPRPPRIVLNIPTPQMHTPTSPQVLSMQVPLSAQTGSTLQGGPAWPSYSNPFQYMYSQKAGEFMTKQFGGIYDFTVNTAKSGMSVGEKSAYWIYDKFSKWSKNWFTHIFLFFVVFLYSVIGALIFQTVEGAAEAKRIEIQEVDMRRDQQEFMNTLQEIALDEEVVGDIKKFEGKVVSLINDYKYLLKEPYDMSSNETTTKRDWTFWNSMFYCGTIYTTIGYGHIAPKTILGQGITIIYAIIGIPIFLILLADFGKLFTRGIKCVWSYVRRLYYTGSCRKVRKTAEVQQVMRSFDMAYDIAIRRPSAFFRGSDNEDDDDSEKGPALKEPQLPVAPETPSTLYPETIEINDEFNLPISLAIFVLLLYIFVGATVYCMWEDWTYFQSFYFVFISMSTVGLGDLVPDHPIFMMCSIVYLAFGLALTSMCINVVQLKLGDSFKNATAKIGATIGLTMAEDARNSQSRTPSDMPEVHQVYLDKMNPIFEKPTENYLSPEVKKKVDNNNETIFHHQSYHEHLR